MKRGLPGMDDLGDKINAILSDPGQLDKIAQMAKSIMGGEDGPKRPQQSEPGDFSIDPDMIKKLSGLMNSGSSDKQTLLQAMRPYLSEKRRRKMDKAIKLARLASFAELAAREFGGEDRDV